MKNLRKTLASMAIMAALVAGCQTNSPTPEVVVVKKPDPITPADTTKKDTTKVVVVPPTPVSPKVIAGQKCYEARVIFVSPCGSVVVQVLNDSIGIKSDVGYLKGSVSPNDPYTEKEYLNALTLKVPDVKATQLWLKTFKVYFTVQEFVDLAFVKNQAFGTSDWGALNSCGPTFSRDRGKIALKGAILSSYSNESCKP